MAVRSTMENLIRRLRRLVQDTGSPPRFQDDDLQEHLDANRRDVYVYGLVSEGTYTSAGVGPQYLNYQAPGGDWEEDATIQNASLTTVSPTTSDYQRGRFTFTTEPSYPLYITGKQYDLNAAAADALEEWAAESAGGYDFSSGGQNFRRSQATEGRLKMAERFRERSWPVSVPHVRSDVESAQSSGDYEATLRR